MHKIWIISILTHCIFPYIFMLYRPYPHFVFTFACWVVVSLHISSPHWFVARLPRRIFSDKRREGLGGGQPKKYKNTRPEETQMFLMHFSCSSSSAWNPKKYFFLNFRVFFLLLPFLPFHFDVLQVEFFVRRCRRRTERRWKKSPKSSRKKKSYLFSFVAFHLFIFSPVSPMHRAGVNVNENFFLVCSVSCFRFGGFTQRKNEEISLDCCWWDLALWAAEKRMWFESFQDLNSHFMEHSLFVRDRSSYFHILSFHTWKTHTALGRSRCEWNWK